MCLCRCVGWKEQLRQLFLKEGKVKQSKAKQSKAKQSKAKRLLQGLGNFPDSRGSLPGVIKTLSWQIRRSLLEYGQDFEVVVKICVPLSYSVCSVCGWFGVFIGMFLRSFCVLCAVHRTCTPYRSVFSRREQWGRKKVKHEIGGRSNHQTKGSTIIYFSFSRIILKSLKESTVNKSLKLVCLCSFLQRPIVSFVCLLFHTLHKFCCPLTPAFGVKCFVCLDTQRLIPDSCLCMNRLEFRREPSGDPDKIQR